MNESKSPLKKETFRYFQSDTDLLRKYFPGDNNKPGINEIVRNIVHNWVDENIRTKLAEPEFVEEKPDISL